MHPQIALDASIVASNARAWQSYSGTPLRAVVKGDGYGWGIGTLVRALDGIAEAFCVADEEELRDLRRHTSTRAIVLGSVPLHALPPVLESNALPTISSVEELEIVRRNGNRVRVGLRPAAAWSGSTMEELRAFAPSLASSGLEVELWSHITDWENRNEQTARFREAERMLRDAGARIVETDLASTMPLAHGGAAGSTTRIGVGLFGATGGVQIPGVRCALDVTAPVVRIERLDADSRIGYGNAVVPKGAEIVTARCGYADGLPHEIAGSDGIIAIGMQYVSAYADRLNGMRTQLTVLDPSSNIDAFAAHAQRLAHEIVTAFGNASRRLDVVPAEL